MIPIVLFQRLKMFFLWLVFTSNLNSQTTWLKVELELVNLSCHVQLVESHEYFHFLVHAFHSRCISFYPDPC